MKLGLLVVFLVLCTAFNVYGDNGCDALSVVERSFSSGMSASNKEMFCKQFSQEMRDAAMDMAGKPDASGDVMTPDEAVEQVAKEHNWGKKGVCPVKK